MRANLGFLLAGIIIFGVGVNVYFEFKMPKESALICQFTSIP